jgi:hypothetical protein
MATIVENLVPLFELGAVVGVYAVVYWAFGWALSRFIKNQWVRWAVIWIVISTLDCIGSYWNGLMDTSDGKNLTPFQMQVGWPCYFSMMAGLPIIFLRWTIFALIGSRLPEGSGNWEQGYWQWSIYFQDILTCLVMFLTCQFLSFCWRLRPRAKTAHAEAIL